MNTHKRILSIILVIVLCAAAAVGVAFAVKKTTSGGTVMVISADSLNYNWYFGGSEESVDGKVTTDATQNVYVSESDTIKRVWVQEGDTVKKNDILLEYDTELAEIALAQRQLELDQIRLNMDVAERNLNTLRSLRPVSEGGGFDLGDLDFPEMPEVTPYEILDANSVSFNDLGLDENLGKSAYPYCYLVYGDQIGRAHV